MYSWNDLTALGVRWQSLIISPTKLPWMALPEVGADPRYAWWKRLRDVPCAYVSSRGESERFLYYDGPTLAAPPVNVTLTDNQLHLKLQTNKAPHERDFPIPWDAQPPQALLLIHHRGGHLSGQVVHPPASWNTENPGITLTLGDDDLHDQQVIETFDRLIQQAGLSADEAEGLLACWSRQFFQSDGTQLLTIMSRPDYDAYCPIEVRPTPTQMVRVGIVLTQFP